MILYTSHSDLYTVSVWPSLEAMLSPFIANTGSVVSLLSPTIIPGNVTFVVSSYPVSMLWLMQVYRTDHIANSKQHMVTMS